MHQDDVARRRGIFQHLQRDSVDRLNALVEPLDAGRGLAGGAEIPQVRMAMDRCPELGSSGPRPRWMIEEPPMDQPMRAADDFIPPARGATSPNIAWTFTPLGGDSGPV